MRAFPVCGIRYLCMSEMSVVGVASNYRCFFCVRNVMVIL